MNSKQTSNFQNIFVIALLVKQAKKSAFVLILRNVYIISVDFLTCL